MDPDLGWYQRRVRDGPCFVCAFLDGHEDYRHHVVYEDEHTVAFLDRYPTLEGHTLVAPRSHIESWIDELSETEHSRFQSVVRRVARALAATVPTERMYSYSLGSRDGNAHLHWHLAPLPPGVPYAQQQFAALVAENGLLRVSDESQSALAAAIRSHL